MDNRPIGVFDSGIGGLSVLSKIVEILPNEEYIYYADTNHVPYGTKTNEQIKEYVKEAIQFLIQKNVKTIVIACNTATSIAIEYLRKEYSIPIIGIEPAAKPAVENRNNKKVLLMATPVTVREEKLKELLKTVDTSHSVDLIAMPGLVQFAEKQDFTSKDVEDYIKKQLKDYNLKEYSELVLGCTHFPFFKYILSKVLPKGIQIIDGSVGVANRLKSVLQNKEEIGNNRLKITYYYSGKKVKDVNELNKMHQLLNAIK